MKSRLIAPGIKNPARGSGRAQITSFNFPNNPSMCDSSRAREGAKIAYWRAAKQTARIKAMANAMHIRIRFLER
jgi:hypothetical protein